MDRPVLSPAFMRELGAACPCGPVGAEIVEAWLTVIWPKMQTYRYRNYRRAIANWWARVTEDDIEDARLYLANLASLAENDRLAELATTANAAPPTAPQRTRAFRVVGGGRCG